MTKPKVAARPELRESGLPAPKPAAKKPAAKAPSKAVAVVEPAPGSPQSMMALIARAAADPAVNTDKMRLLLDMQKEIVAEENRRMFITSFIEMQAELPIIRRDGRIEIREKDASGKRTENSRIQQATPYATYPNIMKAIKPIMRAHGFGYSSHTEPVGEKILVVGTLMHKGSGVEKRSAFPLPAETSGSKNNAQGWGSSASYGKRYNLIGLCDIVSEDPRDDDKDGAAPGNAATGSGNVTTVIEHEDQGPAIDQRQIDNLVELIGDAGITTALFCEKMGVDRIKDLPASRYAATVTRLKNYAANNRGK